MRNILIYGKYKKICVNKKYVIPVSKTLIGTKFEPRKNTEIASAIKPTYLGISTGAAVVVINVLKVVVIFSKLKIFSMFLIIEINLLRLFR